MLRVPGPTYVILHKLTAAPDTMTSMILSPVTDVYILIYPVAATTWQYGPYYLRLRKRRLTEARQTTPDEQNDWLAGNDQEQSSDALCAATTYNRHSDTV